LPDTFHLFASRVQTAHRAVIRPEAVADDELAYVYF